MESCQLRVAISNGVVRCSERVFVESGVAYSTGEQPELPSRANFIEEVIKLKGNPERDGPKERGKRAISRRHPRRSLLRTQEVDNDEGSARCLVWACSIKRSREHLQLGAKFTECMACAGMPGNNRPLYVVLHFDVPTPSSDGRKGAQAIAPYKPLTNLKCTEV
ncbi:hypothetical protein VTI28DRAFT_2592 [Corynascus sepedonium]